MPFVKMTPNNRRTTAGEFSLVGFIIVVLLLVIMACSGCTSTVTPVQVQPATASFDGNTQNSGVLTRLPDGSYSVTAHWRDRYNAMIPIYGGMFHPTLKFDDGIIPSSIPMGPNGTYEATSQAVINFGVMNAKRKSGL